MTPTPRGPGRVVALGTAPKGGAPMIAHDQVTVKPGVGIPGDRYAEGKGTWERFPDRELTLVAAETAEATGVNDPLDLRRNVVTRGVDLNALIGKRFRIGTVHLEGVRSCDPCRYLEGKLQRPGLKTAIATTGGLRARVLEPGTLRVGDDVEIVEPAG